MYLDDDLDPITRAVQRILQGYLEFFYDAWTNQNINAITGDYVEFGSWGGNTMNQAYKAMLLTGRGERHMWAYDSFQGLPEASDPRDYHPGWKPGSGVGGGGVENFYAACDRHGIPRDAYTATEGYFEESIGNALPADEPNDIAICLIDCNLYTSAVTVMEFLEPRLKHGMILAFDDYYCWSPDNVSGEQSVLAEFARDHPEWSFDRYHSIARAGQSFVVFDTSKIPR
ncbi:MAG: O-methyltransferase [Candidatus Aldehydirespiratoraceae bacterium]|jgi:O-methyltransferase